MAAGIALVAPAGAWVATHLFGYNITEPRRIDDVTIAVAVAIYAAGLLVWIGAASTQPE